LPDGRFNFLLQGQKRVRIVRELEVSTLYRQAEVEILEDIEAPWTHETSELIPTYRDVAKRVSAKIAPDFDAMLDRDPPLGVVTDLVAQSLGLPAAMKQALLADQRVDRRASGLLAVLRQVAADLDAKVRRAKSFPPPFSVN
jgi:Lon protease-like protein